MTISARHLVIKTLCSSIRHSLAISPISREMFTGQDYVDMLWSNRPEKKNGSG